MFKGSQDEVELVLQCLWFLVTCVHVPVNVAEQLSEQRLKVRATMEPVDDHAAVVLHSDLLVQENVKEVSFGADPVD